MKVKTPKDSPIAVLYEAAREIVDSTRKVFAQHGQDAREIRLPILMHGTDMRVTIEAGPKVAARNAIEEAQSKATGKPAGPHVDMNQVLNDAKILLTRYASMLHEDFTTNAGEWPPQFEHQRKLHQQAIDTMKGLFEVERLL